MSWFNRALVTLLPLVPKPVVRIFSRPYVAGETLEDMVKAVRKLNAQGVCATVDQLGEFITDFSQAEATAHAYHTILDTIAREGLDANISVKLSALGMLINFDRCAQLLRKIVAHAAQYNNFVRIDMEDSQCTQRTIDLYVAMRQEFGNVGIVLQAYLHRTLDDMQNLIMQGYGHFRLCKGIYIEPPEIAYQEYAAINKNYLAVLENMLKNGAYVGIATHDQNLVNAAQQLISQMSLTKDRYEFQMLLGVDEALRSRIVADGHYLRVYVPFGRDWYAYSMRRLKENPTIAGYVFQSIIKRLIGK